MSLLFLSQLARPALLPELLHLLSLLALVPVCVQLRLLPPDPRRHGIEDLSGVGVNVTAPPCLAICDRVVFEVSRVRVSQFQVDEGAVNGRKYFNL